MSRKVHGKRDLLYKVAARQGDGAVITGPATARWNVAGNCESPVYREMMGATDPQGPLSLGGSNAKERSDRLTLEIEARCRKCNACLRSRAAQWRFRGTAEIARSSRSWFGTLTLAPEHRLRMLNQARLMLTKQRLDFDALPQGEQFSIVCEQINKEVTLWLKRVRKNSGASLRYCLVHEAHKDGFPHLHLLIHEREGRVTQRQLADAWRLGFTKFKLVEGTHVVSYVTKYLSKSALARIRASQKYGL